MKVLIETIENELLPNLKFESVCPYDPVIVYSVPKPWEVIGTGNYAAVLTHPKYQEVVVKIYAPGRLGLNEEAEVYRKIGVHPAYSQCLRTGENYLVLKFLKGITLFDCLRKGIRIPQDVIEDIDQALEYAKEQGLYPHDIHPKNVMMINKRGAVVDISDFHKRGECSKWKDFKKAYYKIYRPIFHKFPIPFPSVLLEAVRKGYRLYKNMHNLTPFYEKISK